MTVTYDPKHPSYLDEADTRGELTRVFDVCDGCRRCVALCSVFPSLFDMIGGHDDRHDDRDAGRLTPEQQDRIVDRCFQCTLCGAACPYTPDRHELQIDLPRLLQRAQAMRFEHGHLERRCWSPRFVSRVLAANPVFGWTFGAPAGSLRRRILTMLTGVSGVRRLPRFAGRHVSQWARQRPRDGASSQHTVVVVPTCMAESHVPAIGRDLVRVYERNGIACTIAPMRCCGAPVLHAGSLATFQRVATANVESLAHEVRAGHVVVVPDPMCLHVIVNEYPIHVPSSDAELVAANTFDSCDYLMNLDTGALDTDFQGAVPAHVAVHTPNRRHDSPAVRAADLLRRTGAVVDTVGATVGDTGWWGMGAGRETEVRRIAHRLADDVAAAQHDGAPAVVTASVFTSLAFEELTGVMPTHPMQLLARAYGIRDDVGDEPSLDEP